MILQQVRAFCSQSQPFFAWDKLTIVFILVRHGSTNFILFAEATRTTSINSCLCVVGSLDGSSITTVEGMGNSAAGFHSVQGELMTLTGFPHAGFGICWHASAWWQ